MNDELYMNGGPGLSIMSSVILFLSLLAIAIKYKQFHFGFFALIAMIVLLLTTSAISSGMINISTANSHLINTISALIQPMLTLFFLVYFAAHEQMQKTLRLTVIILLITGVLIFTRHDIQDVAIPVVLGLGIFIVMMFSIYFFIQQIKLNVHQRHGSGKAFMISGILFSYCCQVLIFLAYYVFRSDNRQDLFTLFDISTFIFGLLTLIGILQIKNTALPAPESSIKKESGVKEWEGFTTHY